MITGKNYTSFIFKKLIKYFEFIKVKKNNYAIKLSFQAYINMIFIINNGKTQFFNKI